MGRLAGCRRGGGHRRRRGGRSHLFDILVETTLEEAAVFRRRDLSFQNHT